MKGKELYRRLADATAININDLIKMSGGSLMDPREVDFAARLLNTADGLRHFERMSSDEPQTFVGIVVEIKKRWGGTCDITYYEEEGVSLGFNRDKEQMKNLYSQGLRVGSVIVVQTALEGGSQRIQRIDVQNLDRRSLTDFAARIIANHEQNDLYR